ncbi:hypothetical protein RJ639_045600 [Escallonia herrerae]|uniref:Dof zinc finger protein n=1 Tax=Escallonia herrerae TaxID=1293975 RepID=A0AA88WAY2_9ASTE|nr:hypothetical protein RJ639_045600 [Escallonia herrerae]
MMLQESMAAKPAGKDEGQNPGSRRTSSSVRPPDQQALKCPRCDSPNTKFCYFNNYSLTQPRHFCKTCRRYWTKGGALRNVPIGGGCRKNKKIKSSSSRLSGSDSKDSGGLSSDLAGLKFFNGLSPAVDFQLGGLNYPPRGTGVYNNNNQFTSFGENLSTTFGLDPSGNSSPGLMGFNFPLTGSVNGLNGNIASSIESLSSINQDLHWKLQQQRLAMLFGGGGDNIEKQNGGVPHVPMENQIQKPQPILFQNLEITKVDIVRGEGIGSMNSRKEGGSGNLATEWFFDNSFAPAVNQTPTNSGSTAGNENGSNWNGVQAWSNLSQYSALP